MAQYAMITEPGLNDIDNAHSLGQYIEIAYYVPAYDYRIDPNILPTDSSISATEISTCTNSADYVPQGEVLWNVSGDSYGLSPEQTYLVRTGSETVTTSGTNQMITNFAHREVFTINQFKTSAISDYYTADTVISPGTGGNAWFLSNAGYELLSTPLSGDGYGPANVNEPEARFLYKGVTYQHVITSANDSRANFKITMRAEKGQIKFNKVGLYAVKRTADGVIAADPFLFGQVIIPEPQVLYSKDAGSSGKVTEITLDFQIDSKTINAGIFESVFYSTSGDYWVRTTNEKNGNYGLTYDGSVYITNSLGIDETGAVLEGDSDRSVAKLLVSTFECVNKPVTSAEREMPQLCLQYVSSQGVESKRIRTTLKTNTNGDCEFDLYGACLSAHSDNYSLIPTVDKGYGLGLNGNRWSHLYLSDKLEMFNDTWDDVVFGTNFSDAYINIDISNKMANFGNTDLYVGPYHNTTKIQTYDGKKYLKIIENENYIYGNLSSYVASGTNDDGVFEHGYDLLVRSLNDSVMITLSAGNRYSFTAEEIISRVWKTLDDKDTDFKYDETILPYLGKDKDILLVAGRNIYTHGNIVPLRNRIHDLGWWDNQFAHIFTENITGWNKYDGNGRQLTFHSNLVPTGGNYKIKENGWTNDEWYEITAKQFGRSDKYVDKAYLRTIYTHNIFIDKTGSLEFDGGIKMTQKSIFGNINNIGTSDNPVGIIYVDDLVLTKKYKTYTIGDLSTPKDNGHYYPYFGHSDSNSFKFTDITARYSSIQQHGNLYMTMPKDQWMAQSRDTFKPDRIPSDMNVVSIPYDDMMSVFGFSSMQFLHSTSLLLQQWVHSKKPFDNGDFILNGEFIHDSDSNGVLLTADYTTLKVFGSHKEFWKFLPNNGIKIVGSDVILTFYFTGNLSSSWKEQK